TNTKHFQKKETYAPPFPCLFFMTNCEYNVDYYNSKEQQEQGWSTEASFIANGLRLRLRGSKRYTCPQCYSVAGGRLGLRIRLAINLLGRTQGRLMMTQPINDSRFQRRNRSTLTVLLLCVNLMTYFQF
ncbi:hypothetical protein ACFLS1_10665, partial [Verrucomicrobiota bacterium]